MLADIAARARGKRGKFSPLALEAVQRLDALLDIERQINGLSAEERLTARQERSAPLVEELESWLRSARAGLSRQAPLARSMDYMLGNWAGFTRFLTDGGICLSHNATGQALAGLPLLGLPVGVVRGIFYFEVIALVGRGLGTQGR